MFLSLLINLKKEKEERHIKKKIGLIVLILMLSACSKTVDSVQYDLKTIQNEAKNDITIVSARRESSISTPLRMGKRVETSEVGFDYIDVVATVKNNENKSMDIAELVDLKLVIDGDVVETFMYVESLNGQGIELAGRLEPNQVGRTHFTALVEKSSKITELGFVLDGVDRMYNFKEVLFDEPVHDYVLKKAVVGKVVSFSVNSVKGVDELVPSKSDANDEYQFLKAPNASETLLVASVSVRNLSDKEIVISDYLGFRVLNDFSNGAYTWFQEDVDGLGFSEITTLQPSRDYKLYLINYININEVKSLKQLSGMFENQPFSMSLSQ